MVGGCFLHGGQGCWILVVGCWLMVGFDGYGNC